MTLILYWGLLNHRSSDSNWIYSFWSLKSLLSIRVVFYPRMFIGHRPPFVLPCHYPSIEYISHDSGKIFPIITLSNCWRKSVKLIHQDPSIFLVLGTFFNSSLTALYFYQSSASSQKAPVQTPSLPQGFLSRISLRFYLGKSLISMMV